MGDAAEPQGRGTGQPLARTAKPRTEDTNKHHSEAVYVGQCSKCALPVLDRWHCDRLGWGRTAGLAAGTWRKCPTANLCLQGHTGVYVHVCLVVSGGRSIQIQTLHYITSKSPLL